nr:hypothetical protein [Tanacetum cinerariifolium]
MNRNRVTIKTMMAIIIRMIYQGFLVVITVGDPMKLSSVNRWPKILIFPKLLEDLKELAEYKESLENSSKEIVASNSNQEKEEPPQDSNIRHLIREECSVEVSEEQKQKMEDTILELAEICRQKELLCMHDNVDYLIESALNSKLLSINSQRLVKKEQEVKNVIEQPAEHGNCSIETFQNFRVIRKSSISLKNTSQISPVQTVTPILSTKNLSTHQVWDDDDISSDDNDFEDIEFVEASLTDPEIVSVEEENVVQQEEEEIDFEDISQIQDVDLHEKLLSITHLISNTESLNDNPNPDRELNSSVSIPIFEETDNSLSDTFSLKFETFCDHAEETRSGNTTHADNSLPEYDLFCFEIEPDQERLINVMKNDISDESTNDPLLEEADLFLTSDNSIPPGIENSADHSEGDIRFFEALLIDDSILFPNNESSESEDNLSFPRPPSEPPDAEFDAEEEIPVMMNDKDEIDDYSSFMFVIYSNMFLSFLSAKSEDTIFDPVISD